MDSWVPNTSRVSSVATDRAKRVATSCGGRTCILNFDLSLTGLDLRTRCSPAVRIQLLGHSIGPCHDVELCDGESGKGEAAIKSQALGLLNPGMKRSQTEALTVPYVVAGLCAKPAKYS